MRASNFDLQEGLGIQRRERLPFARQHSLGGKLLDVLVDTSGELRHFAFASHLLKSVGS